MARPKPTVRRPTSARRNIAKAQFARLGKRGERKKATILKRL